MLSRASRGAGPGRRGRFAGRRARAGAVLAALAIVASGAIVACSDGIAEPLVADQATLELERKTAGPLNPQNIGAYHNDFLDFVYPRMLRAVSGGADRRAVCKVIAAAMREFVVERRIPVDPKSIRDDIAGPACAGSPGKGPNPAIVSARLSLAGDGVPSPELDATVAEMQYAIEAGHTQSELTLLFNKKVTYARANFPQAEADVIEAAASVGLSSVQYWDANYETQEQEGLAAMQANAYSLAAEGSFIFAERSQASATLLVPGERRDEWTWRSRARAVGGADLVGAVRGGIKGWAGGWVGIGIGALTEGGASSAAAFIGSLLQ